MTAEHLSMTQTEREFITVYIRALKNDYWRLNTIMGLMDPESGLGITNFLHALELADKLNDMRGEFEHDLLEAGKNFVRPQKYHKLIDSPTPGQLADFFALSFFKLMSAEQALPYGSLIKKDNGWSSGAPGTVENLLNFLGDDFFQKKKSSGKDAGSFLLDMLSQFFQLPLPNNDVGYLGHWNNFLKQNKYPAQPDDAPEDPYDDYDDQDDEDDY